jgi:hypothetical protein
MENNKDDSHLGLIMQLIRSDSPDCRTGTGVSARYKNENLYKSRLIIL